MNNLRKTLLVGLGGTGTKAILHTKARLIKTYGRVPEMINFLAFDTSDKDRSITSPEGEHVELTENNEFHHLTVDNVQDYVSRNTLIKQDFPIQNFGYYRESAVREGAAQIRALGRISLIRNYNRVVDALEAAYARITHWGSNTGTEAYRSNVRIVVVFSLAGGTGSGMFLDLAYLIRNIRGLNEHDEIFGYIVLPDVYQDKPNTEQIKPNAYAALKELEFVTDEVFNMESLVFKNFTFKYPDNHETIVKQGIPPFDRVLLINNVNKQNLRFNDDNEISQLISSSIFVTMDADDKMNKAWENSFPEPLKDKHRRYMGMGVFEIVFDGEMAKKLGALNHSKKLLETLRMIDQGITDDANLEAMINEWMLNEYKDNDQVLNRVLQKVESGDIEPIEKPGKGKKEEIIHNCERFIIAYRNKAKLQADGNLQTIIKTAKTAIHDYLNTVVLKSRFPLGTAIEFLDKLIKKFRDFQDEIKTEETELTHKMAALHKGYDSVKKEIDKIENKVNIPLLNRIGKALMPQVENYYSLSRKEADLYKNKLRREYAQIIYGALINDLDSLKKQYQDLIRFALNDIKLGIDKEINAIRMKRTTLPFTINLHEHLYSTITLERSEINMKDFMIYLFENGLGIEKWAELDSAKIKDAITGFTNQLPSLKSWSDKSVDDVLAENFSNEECSRILKMAMENSSPCWELYRDDVTRTNTFLICGVNNPSDSFITRFKQSGNDIKLFLEPDFISTTNDPTRIIFLQIEHSSPAFSVRDMKTYKREYERNLKKTGKRINHHANTALERFMNQLSFDIFPFDEEHVNRAMAAWILGLLMQYIEKKGGSYYYKSPQRRLKENKPDDWFSFDTTNRKDAFEHFAQSTDLIDEFFLMQKEWIKINGESRFRQIIDSLVLTDESGNILINEEIYFRDFSRFKIKLETLKNNRAYAEDLGLYAREKNFILTDLEAYIK